MEISVENKGENKQEKESLNRIGKEYNDFCIISGNPEIGEGTWVGYHTIIDGSGGLKIGKKCCIASGVHIYTHDSIRAYINNIEKDTKNRTHLDFAQVTIGDNVFIGANSVVLKGVKIGNRVLIGAMSLVNKDLPDDCIAFGNPIEIRGYRKEIKSKTNKE